MHTTIHIPTCAGMAHPQSPLLWEHDEPKPRRMRVSPKTLTLAAITLAAQDKEPVHRVHAAERETAH